MRPKNIYPTIALCREDRERAATVARLRNRSALARGAQGTNNLHVNDKKALQLHMLGACCELAAFHFFRGVLPWYDWEKSFDDTKADLGERIEVKGKKTAGHRLLVPEGRLNRDRIYLSVSAEFRPYYQIRGWWHGRDFDQTSLYEPTKGRLAYACFDRVLRDPMELLESVLKSQQREAA